MFREPIATTDAPAAIGTYSQAVRVGETLYLSGQIPLDPASGELVSEDPEAQIRQAFTNLHAVIRAAGGQFADIAKLNVYLIDLGHFPIVNEVMAELFTEPFPARAALGVAALPKGAQVEVDAIVVLPT